MLAAKSFILALLIAATAQAFIQRPASLKTSRLFSTESGETDDQIRERLRAKARKMMFNENGVAYAPWVARQIDEDAIVEDLLKKEKGLKNKKSTSILDRGEIESSEGMKWRMSGDLVELGWSTSSEDNNVGYIVEKRPSYGGDFQEIASFQEVTTLASKGVSGGR
jgi:hypothetical protein